MNDKDIGKWYFSKESYDIINKMKHGDKLYMNMPRGNGTLRKSVLKWIMTLKKIIMDLTILKIITKMN